MRRPALEGCWKNGVWRGLFEPDGQPTGRQLLKFNALGLVDLTEHRVDHPITKGEAAYAIDEASA